jgi:hypothetical protein
MEYRHLGASGFKVHGIPPKRFTSSTNYASIAMYSGGGRGRL